jgi:hypothetical protein
MARHHGWAAARADLDNPENKKEYVFRRTCSVSTDVPCCAFRYEDVYTKLVGFFEKSLI